MSGSVNGSGGAGHLLRTEIKPQMVKADLRKAETGDLREEIGAALKRAAFSLGWNLQELAVKLGRDERQVARWFSGVERVQVDVVFGVIELRGPFVIALAQLSEQAEIVTTISLRKVG